MNKKILLIAMLSIAHIHTMDVPNDKEKAFTSENLDQIIEHTLPITTQKIQKVIKHEDYLFFLLDDHTIKAYNLETRGSFHINIQVSLPLLEKVFLLKPKIKHISEIFTSNGTLYMPVATDDKVFLAEVRLPKNDNTVITLDINKKIITHNTSICSLHTVMSKIKEKTTNAVFVISSSHYPSMKIWKFKINKQEDSTYVYTGALNLGITTGDKLFCVKDYLSEKPFERWLQRNNKTLEKSFIYLLDNSLTLDKYNDQSFIMNKEIYTYASECFLHNNTKKNYTLYGGFLNKHTNANSYWLLYSDTSKSQKGCNRIYNKTTRLQEQHPKKLLFFYSQEASSQNKADDGLRMIVLFDEKLMVYNLTIKDDNESIISYGHEIKKIDADTYETMLFDQVNKAVYCICKKKNLEKKILYTIPINALDYNAQYLTTDKTNQTKENYPFIAKSNNSIMLNIDSSTKYNIQQIKLDQDTSTPKKYNTFKFTERAKIKQDDSEWEEFTFDSVNDRNASRIIFTINKSNDNNHCTMTHIPLMMRIPV